jgi:transposase InsO family protein
MRIRSNLRGTKGFVIAWERLIRFKYMITEKAKERTRILAFWERHGDAATCEAFGVSRRTLYRWQQALEKGCGKLASLNPYSTAPVRRRMRNINTQLTERIIALRTKHPRLGKEKVHALLKKEGYIGSVSTIGRILSDLKARGSLPSSIPLSFHARTGAHHAKHVSQRKKLRRPQHARVLELDTVVRFVDGMKRYTLTAVDTEKKTAFAGVYTNHGSGSASDFLRRCIEVIPDCPTHIQTDNGSEFAKYFRDHAENLGLTHYHTYPRSPKMNAHVERFNRTLSEEFLVYHKAELRDDVSLCNKLLIDWLLWYNGERPHHSLRLLSPFDAMMVGLEVRECQMWWTNTGTLQK